jgi:hypothetical protein
MTQDPDLTQLESITNQRLTGDYSVPLRAEIISYTIDHNVVPAWALVDWGCFPSGGEIAARQDDGKIWKLKFQRVGIYKVRQLAEAGMPIGVATWLKANMHQFDHRTITIQSCEQGGR